MKGLVANEQLFVGIEGKGLKSIFLPLSSPSSLVASALALAHHQEAKLKKKEEAAAKLSHLAFQDENQWIKGAMLLGQGLWAP